MPLCSNPAVPALNVSPSIIASETSWVSSICKRPLVILEDLLPESAVGRGPVMLEQPLSNLI